MAGHDGRVLIAGGGIGGLATAIALDRRGVDTEVLERSHLADETGAGIQLGPNVTRTLEALGALDAIEPLAFRPEAIVIYDGISGRRLTSTPLGRSVEERYRAPYLTLHRADLHAALRSVAETYARVMLKPGFDVAAIDAQGHKIVARDVDGHEASGSSLIGADGLWSRIRALVMPEARLRFTGVTARRALVPRHDLPSPFDAPNVGLWLGPGSHIVHYPVRGGEMLNVVAVTQGGSAREGWNQMASDETLLAGFARWAKDSKSLLEQASSWRGWPLYDLVGRGRWSVGRVALLGDAAHPLLPYLAQGAALAIEDAATLAACITSQPGDPVKAFARYEELRRPRAERVARVSRRFGRLYHLRGPLRLARNFILERRSEERALPRLDWLYRQNEDRTQA
jgi:2-polyprenyl-6-methoxyphenol hydroxylase-like FAD-dependent oxidoreductase